MINLYPPVQTHLAPFHLETNFCQKIYDGTLLNRHAYVYKYDDVGNLAKALYASDSPAMPGEFNKDKGYYNEEIGYDTGGNIVRLKRNREATVQSFPLPVKMDDLEYTYQNGGYLPIKIKDNGEEDHTPQRKHFVDGVNQNIPYFYSKTTGLESTMYHNLTPRQWRQARNRSQRAKSFV